MTLDGPFGDAQLSGDHAVAIAGAQRKKDISLTSGQSPKFRIFSCCLQDSTTALAQTCRGAFLLMSY
ncbi:hypothetical protein [Streptomyces sp. NPDC047453]|uniref:hypothetical protein n=1 Tax=Streptomyces sp. NPDC047453 TaxID=3154812 RepID=UPI0033F157A2